MSFKKLLNSLSKQMFNPSAPPEETQSLAESIKDFDKADSVVVMGDPMDLTSVSSFKREYLAPIEEPIPTGIDLTPNPGYKKKPKGKTYKYVDPHNDPTFIENLWKA